MKEPEGILKKMYILTERNFFKKKHHVAYDTILGMEDEFAMLENVEIYSLSTIMRFINEISYRAFNILISDITINCIDDTNTFFYAAMSLYNLKINCKTLKRLKKKGAQIIIYCFDTWEPQYEEWERLFSYINPNYIFLAYKQSVNFFCKKYKNVFWLPQSMNRKYFFDRHEKKSRMFMQMGRRTEKIHLAILEYLKKRGLENIDENYIYEKEKGKLIFPDTEELARNINATKYFICAPQSCENTKKTGKVSDVTARYYEAMACKSLIIGYKPKVFDQLFPYKAMAELNADASNLEDIVDYYENNPNEYDQLINLNYEYVMTNHTWTKRIAYILDILVKYDS